MSGQLEGATLSDNGFPIIAMFFDLPNSDELSLARQRAMQATKNRIECVLYRMCSLPAGIARCRQQALTKTPNPKP
jgi:hypothetical protein